MALCALFPCRPGSSRISIENWAVPPKMAPSISRRFIPLRSLRGVEFEFLQNDLRVDLEAAENEVPIGVCRARLETVPGAHFGDLQPRNAERAGQNRIKEQSDASCREFAVGDVRDEVEVLDLDVVAEKGRLLDEIVQGRGEIVLLLDRCPRPA